MSVNDTSPIFCLPDEDDDPPSYSESLKKCKSRSRRGSRQSLYGLPDDQPLPPVHATCSGTFLAVPKCCAEHRVRRASDGSVPLRVRPRSAGSSPLLRDISDQKTNSAQDVRPKNRRCSRQKLYGLAPSCTVPSVLDQYRGSAESLGSQGSRKSAPQRSSRSSLYGLHPSDSIPSVLSHPSSSEMDPERHLEEEEEEEEEIDCRRKKKAEDSDEECVFHEHTERKSHHGNAHGDDDDDERHRKSRKAGRKEDSDDF